MRFRASAGHNTLRLQHCCRWLGGFHTRDRSRPVLSPSDAACQFLQHTRPADTSASSDPLLSTPLGLSPTGAFPGNKAPQLPRREPASARYPRARSFLSFPRARKPPTCPLSPRCPTDRRECPPAFSAWSRSRFQCPLRLGTPSVETRHVPPTRSQKSDCWIEALLQTASALAVTSASAMPLLPRPPDHLDG